MIPEERVQGRLDTKISGERGFGESDAMKSQDRNPRGGSWLKGEANLPSGPGCIVLRQSKVDLAESPHMHLKPHYSFFLSLIRCLLNTYCVLGFKLPACGKVSGWWDSLTSVTTSYNTD